mgnify:CR=1 FL=1
MIMFMFREFYAYIVECFKGNDRALFTVLIALCHTIPVVLHEVFLFTIGWLKLFEQCKIQPDKPVDSSLVGKLWTHSILSHLIFMPLLLWFGLYPIVVFLSGNNTELPTTMVMLKDLAVCVLLEDALFFWAHRLLHHPALYKHCHKKHHEFKVLTGYSMASEYTHPVETLLGNIVPVVAGPLVTKCGLYTLAVWIILRMLKTCDAHSGYAFRWSPFGICWPLNPAVRHDYHHETGLGSYGSFFIFWDAICETNADYIQHETKRLCEKEK